MLDRKHSNSFKQSPTQDSHNKTYYSSDDPRIRVLQNDLVFVNGLPSSIACKDVLNKQLYFGRYGKVVKSILNPPYPYKKGVNYQAYATYENQLDASIAIVALDGFTLSDRPLKVSYGTTKYCAYFLKGRECTNSDCIYLHRIERQCEVVNGDTRIMFRQQNDRAIDMVLCNLEEVCERIVESKIEHVEEGFPSLTEMVEFLIESGYLQQEEYDSVLSKVVKKKTILDIYKEDNKAQSDIDIKQLDQSQTIESIPKLIKSNSFSTMTSPNKPETSTEFDDQEKKVYEIDTRQQALTQSVNYTEQLQDRTARSHVESKKCYQTALDFDEKIEENISQKIIKEIMRKKGIKSRFEFVSIDMKKNEAVEEIKRVKNIIQRFLITYQ